MSELSNVFPCKDLSLSTWRAVFRTADDLTYISVQPLKLLKLLMMSRSSRQQNKPSFKNGGFGLLLDFHVFTRPTRIVLIVKQEDRVEKIRRKWSIKGIFYGCD